MSKVLAVGDIHTKQWIIFEVAKLIDDYDKIVFVGDYADDWGSGPLDTIRTWQTLRMFHAMYPEKVNLVIGNHDYIYLHRTSSISSGYNRATQLLLDSPENRSLKQWMYDIPVKVEIDGITFSHAGFNTEWDDNETDFWRDDSPIWIRPDSIPYGWSFRDNQVFGHTPSTSCWEIPSGKNVWCIDTFSTYRDGTPIGDQTVLEIIDGKTFNKKSIKNENNSNTTSFEDKVS